MGIMNRIPLKGKGALYHCNYCNKDITNFGRMKCNIFADFDLCIECASVGMEVWPHKSDHPYRHEKLVFPGCLPWPAHGTRVASFRGALYVWPIKLGRCCCTCWNE